MVAVVVVVVVLLLMFCGGVLWGGDFGVVVPKKCWEESRSDF